MRLLPVNAGSRKRPEMSLLKLHRSALLSRCTEAIQKLLMWATPLGLVGSLAPWQSHTVAKPQHPKPFLCWAASLAWGSEGADSDPQRASPFLCQYAGEARGFLGEKSPAFISRKYSFLQSSPCPRNSSQGLYGFPAFTPWAARELPQAEVSTYGFT